MLGQACERRTLGPPGGSGSGGVGGTGQGAGGLGFEDPDADGPPPLDAAGLCGNQLHEVIFDAPNVYFVLDASGSMLQEVGGETRYEALHEASVELVRSLGPLIRVGAAVFPFDPTEDAPCAAGHEVMEVTPGDTYDGDTFDGPTTKKFKNATDVYPIGGTPVSKTLTALTPGLLALTGTTIVILATDGGPNCNADATCGPEACMPNLEGSCPVDNCCAEEPDGGLFCVDEPATVDALDTLREAGIKTYVVGIPGSEEYADVLDAMAFSGGAPQLVSPHYFRVDDVSELVSVFKSVAAVVISCEFDLGDPPPEPGQTNVYLDSVVLPYDLANGWRWKPGSDTTVVELRGEACERLKAGQVKQVQIVSGCPTEIPN